MERTYRKPAMRVGSGAITALLVLLAGTGTSVASDATGRVQLATMAEAAPLEQGAGYGSPAEAKRVRVLQRVLRTKGWAPGRVDGLFGVRTEAAVVRFQAAAGLTADGVAGPHTWNALAQALATRLRRGAGYMQANGLRSVRALQRRLRRDGFNPGPVDGRYGPRTEAAVARFQRIASLRASGAVDDRTRRVLARGPERRDGSDRSIAASLEGILPRALPSLTVAPLAASEVDTANSVSLWVAILVAALALLIGAWCGGMFARSRARAQGSVEESAAPSDEVQVLDGGELAQKPAEEPTAMPAGARDAVRAVGYVSVPKVNGDDAASMEAQAAAIDHFCARRGWELLHVVRDVENGHPKGLERPGLLYALERLAEGEAACLVVPELERLSRSAADLGRILEWIEERNGRLVAIDLRLDTGSAQGRLTARTLMAVGEWEGRRIADQTRKGLAAARARRSTTGRPAVEDRPALKERIVSLRQEGLTLQAIADQLNEEGVPTLRGGSEWRPSSVQAAAGYRRPKSKRSNPKDAPKGDQA